MNNNELREQVTQFMAEYKFDPYLDEICESEEIRAIGQDHYDILVKSMTSLFEKAPEVLSENVSKLKAELGDYSFVDFMEDFRTNYAIQEYNALKPALELSDDDDYKRALCYLARGVLSADNPEVIDMAIEVFEAMSNRTFEAACGAVYDGYVPAGIDPEAFEMVKRLMGTEVFIPGEHYFDYLDNMIERFGGGDEDPEDEEEVPMDDLN